MKKLTVGYEVHGLTHLRYFMPLVTLFKQHMPELDHHFFHTRSSSKYNGLHSAENWHRYQTIIDTYGISSCEYSSDVQCDVLITVESTDFDVSAVRHVAIAHGLDCKEHVARLTNCDMYVCCKAIVDAGLTPRLHTCTPPLPISLLTHDEVRSWARREFNVDDDARNVITVFYPDRGFTDVADATIHRLESLGYRVYVKQRRKWQHITARAGMHVYDASWYPSESIALPLISEFVIGFGSTAYLDLVEAGVPYIDVDVWNICMQHSSPFYLRCATDVDAIIDVTHRAPRPTIRQCDTTSLTQFLREVVG